jgi:hypothetical protein
MAVEIRYSGGYEFQKNDLKKHQHHINLNPVTSCLARGVMPHTRKKQLLLNPVTIYIGPGLLTWRLKLFSTISLSSLSLSASPLSSLLLVNSTLHHQSSIFAFSLLGLRSKA